MKKLFIMINIFIGYLFSDSLIVETVGILQLYTFTYDLWVKDTFAYVAADTGLIIINISNPANPYVVKIDRTHKKLRSIWIRDTLAYIGLRRRYFLVYNIKDPLSPYEIGRCSTGTAHYDIYIKGNLAYTAAGAGGLRIISISDPTNPVLVGANSDSSLIYLCGSGNYVYGVKQPHLLIYDVSDSSNPVIIASAYQVSMYFGPRIANWANYVAVTTMGYGPAGIDGGLYIYDVSNPYNPQLIYLSE
ncbi:MAG: hypothetical protein ABDH37_05530, partial [Candidatus Hydrothermales bacterium]